MPVVLIPHWRRFLHCSSSTVQSIRGGSCVGEKKKNACLLSNDRGGGKHLLYTGDLSPVSDFQPPQEMMFGVFTVGSNFCQGTEACQSMSGDVTNGSCIGNNAFVRVAVCCRLPRWGLFCVGECSCGNESFLATSVAFLYGNTPSLTVAISDSCNCQGCCVC